MEQLPRTFQLYSRVGFAHQHRTLADDELVFVLQRHWKRLGKPSTPTTSPTIKPSPPPCVSG